MALQCMCVCVFVWVGVGVLSSMTCLLISSSPSPGPPVLHPCDLEGDKVQLGYDDHPLLCSAISYGHLIHRLPILGLILYLQNEEVVLGLCFLNIIP
jgi:hypothetical protein